MKTIRPLLIAGLCALLYTPLASAAEQSACVVCSKHVTKKAHVDHAGCRLVVCGTACAKEVRTKPDFYLQKLGRSGIKVAAAASPTAKSGAVMQGRRPGRYGMRP
jgi:hypothetical protein